MQEIHEKIMSMGLEDCKVYIHSVDAQAAIDNGIIIQVLGEMSNRGEAWRKFAQTFFLAEQPKGYYVHNDIFRYLKEESVEDDEIIAGDDAEAPLLTEEQESASESVEEAQPEPVGTIPTQTMEVPTEEPIREPTPSTAPETTPEEPPIQKPQLNGVHHDEEAEELPAAPPAEPVVAADTPTVVVPEPVQESAPSVAASTPAQASPAPAPAQALPPAAEKPAQPQAPPQQQPPKPAEPEKPAGPRTWANLAAANSNKWRNLATESRGMSVEAAPSPPPATAAPRATNQAPASIPQSSGAPPAHHGNRNVREVAASLTRGEVFVKGLVDPMTNADLENLLSKYGKIKAREFVRQRAIAFIEFEDVESARAAIIESANVGIGGGGGIFFNTNDPKQGSMRIIVDVKREKGDKERPPARPRQGGVPNQPSSDRGGFRGRGGGGQRGRGITAGGK